MSSNSLGDALLHLTPNHPQPFRILQTRDDFMNISSQYGFIGLRRIQRHTDVQPDVFEEPTARTPMRIVRWNEMDSCLLIIESEVPWVGNQIIVDIDFQAKHKPTYEARCHQLCRLQPISHNVWIRVFMGSLVGPLEFDE